MAVEGDTTGAVTRAVAGSDVDAAAQAARNVELNTGVKPATTSELPAGLPEGYKSVEDFVKAVHDGTYKPAGEVKTEAAKAEPAKDDPLAKAATPELPPEIANHPVVGQAMKDFAAKGDLAPEQVKDIATKLNIPEALVQGYVDNAKQVAAQKVTDSGFDAKPFHEVAGGAEGWGKFVEWANANKSPAEVKAWGDAVNSNPTAALSLTKEFFADYKQHGGGEQRRDITAENTGKTTGQALDTYDSWAQVKVDMNDPRYLDPVKRDPAFIKAVEQKLARSQL